MRTICVIQARTGSTRLTNKVFRTLRGVPVLHWVVRRVQRFAFIDDVCLATTRAVEDDAIEALAHACGLPCVRTSVRLDDGRNDVLDRYRTAAELLKADQIVRVTADCPFISPCLSAEVWAAHRHRNVRGYTSNTLASLDGFDTEIFARPWLDRAAAEATDLHDRHHVTPWIQRHTRAVHQNLFVPQPQVYHAKLSLDTEEDWLRLSMVATELGGLTAEWPDVLEAATRLQLFSDGRGRV